MSKELVYPSEGLNTYPVVAIPSSYDDMIVKKKVFTDDEVLAILKDIQQEIEENVLADDPDTTLTFLQARETCVAVIQQKINELKGNASGNNS